LKYPPSHVAEAVAPIEAAPVRVTVSGSPELPVGPTTSGDASAWLVLAEAVASCQYTSLPEDDAPHAASELASPDVLKPVAKLDELGTSIVVIVTGNGLGFVIFRTTSPVPSGYKRFVGDGDETAVTVMFFTVAPCAKPLEPEARDTTHCVSA
jgi:hypothetical protein